MVSTLASNTHTMVGDCQVPIYYEDTDLSGFVFHANYLKYFDRAREELIGVRYLQSLWQQGVHFVVIETELKYLSPLSHGDLFTIHSTIEFSQSPVLSCKQEGFRIEPNGQRSSVVRGTVKLATLNQANKPIRLPQAVIEYFLSRGKHLKNEDQDYGKQPSRHPGL